MFGYATDESAEMMPLPILLAHKLTNGLADDRKAGKVDFLRPDSKSQVSVAYDGNEPEGRHRGRRLDAAHARRRPEDDHRVRPRGSRPARARQLVAQGRARCS